MTKEKKIPCFYMVVKALDSRGRGDVAPLVGEIRTPIKFIKPLKKKENTEKEGSRAPPEI